MFKIRKNVNKIFVTKSFFESLMLCIKISLLAYSPFVAVSLVSLLIIYGFRISEENIYYIILLPCGKCWIGGIITILPLTLVYLIQILSHKMFTSRYYAPVCPCTKDACDTEYNSPTEIPPPQNTKSNSPTDDN